MADIVSTPKVLGSPSWILPGIVFDSSVEVEFEINPVSSTSSDHEFLFVPQTDWSRSMRNRYSFGTLYATGFSSNQTAVGSLGGSRHVIKRSYNSVTVDGTEKSIAAGTVPTDKPLVLFGASFNSSTFYNLCTGDTLYYCKVWKAGELVRDFIPLASGTTVGSKTLTEDALYDQANKVLYYYGSTTTEQVEEEVTPTTVETPTIGISTAGVVTLSCATSGATIYYTTNGSTPSASSNKYSATFTVLHGATIKAIAVLNGTSSSVASGTYTAPEVTAPSIVIGTDGTVIIVNTVTGADVYYTTNGSTPTTSSNKYSAGFTVTDGTTVKAIAVKYGRSSSVKSVTYTKVTVASPTIAIDEDGKVTITTNTSGAATYYTTNGSTPTSSSTKYTAQFTVASGTTVKAVSVMSGVSSSVESLTYIKAEPVTGVIIGRGYITIAAVSDGTSVTITSTSVTYQLCASGTTAPTGTWSATIPAATDALPYLWTRTVVNYSDGKSTTSYSVSYKGKDGEGTQGKGALEVTVSPETLTFDTTDKGTATIGTSNKATVTCYQDGTDVTAKCSSFAVSSTTNCAASISGSTVAITAITSDPYTGASNETLNVSRTSGSARVSFSYGGKTYYAEVRFIVNVNAYYASLTSTQKEYTQKYGEITTALGKKANTSDLDNYAKASELTRVESSISQTAREISLSVSEKTVGRRNLLVGSAFRKQDEGCEIVLNGHYDDNGIQINAGKDGTNCIKVTAASSTDYSGAFWRQDDTLGANVKISHNTKYVLSAYVKVSSTNVTVSTEILYRKGGSGNVASDRDGRPTSVKLVSPTLVAGEWQLHYFIFETDSSHDYIEVNVWICGSGTAYICKPMLEEGDSYNGWTLSEQDYDYVGGNLLDNTRTLQMGDSLTATNGTVTQKGFSGESATIYSYMHDLVARISSKTSLPSSASVGDCYACTDTWQVWQYTGTSVSDDTTYKGFEYLGEQLHNDLIVASFTMEQNKDYILSWYARGTGRIGAYVGGSSQQVFSEHSDKSLGAVNTYGEDPQALSSEWKRFWMHIRPTGGTVTQVIIRQYRNGDNTSSYCHLSQPKLEEGATLTEYTERKTDLIDKASLKAAGIAIDSTSVTLYGDQVKVSSTQGGTPYAMFTDGKFNANLIEAKVLKTYNTDNGAHIEIENGLMSVFGTMGMPNIRFGVNDSGMAVLSYYDNNGTKLYDLGPGGLDASALKSATLSSAEYVLASKFLGTADFYQMSSFANGKYTVYQVKSAYNAKLFGTQMYNDGDMEVKNNDSSHTGYKPFTSAATVTIYQYTAARIDGTIVSDTSHGLSAEMAAKADGKYFTSTTMVSGSTLVNLATGIYFRKDAAVTVAPSPMVSVDEGSYKWPAYAIGITKFQDGEVVTSGLEVSFYGRLFSTIERTLSASLLAE